MRTGILLATCITAVPLVGSAWLSGGWDPEVEPQAAEMALARGTALESMAGSAEGIEWFWAINGPVSADAGGDVSVDSAGNVFIAGGHGGLDMDNDGEVDLPLGATAYVGANNSYVMKLGKNRPGEPMKIRWIRSPSSPADRTQAKVAADGTGGAYLTGAFAESLSFRGGPNLAGAGGNDAFIARYDADGSVVWARVFGGPGGGDAIYGVASDHEANAYLVGTGSHSFPLDDSGASFSSGDRRAAALVSYGPEGTVRWLRIFGPGIPLVYGVRLAPTGELYITGELEGAADLDDDGVIDLPAPSNRGGFVARFDRGGALLGAWRIPLPAVPSFMADGDIILAGALGGPLEQRYGPADFDGDGTADIVLKDRGPTGTWIARYSPAGELRWAQSYALERPADVEVRGQLIALSGNYKGVRDLDSDGVNEPVLTKVDPSLETDLAIMLLSVHDGHAHRVWTAPGPGNDWANAVAFLPGENSLLVTGAIQLTADFTGDGENGEGWIVCENLGDVFVAQYQLPEPPTPAEAPRSEIVLTAALAERETELYADLTWSGATSALVDIYRHGTLIATVANSGSHSDLIQRGEVARPYRYRVCQAGTQVCSATWSSQR